MDQEKDDVEKVEKFFEMGMGKLGSHTMIFPRTFRFTLHPTNHDDVRWWFQKIKVDYKNKVLETQVYDDVNGEVHEWLEDMQRDQDARSAQLRHYDGCGHILYTIDFLGMECKEHVVDYDYASSDVLTHKLKISFRRSRRINKLNIN